MLTIKALPDGSEQALPCLGTLCPLQGEPSVGVRLVKKITVDGIGSYKKELHTPLYKNEVMCRLSVTSPDRSFDAAHCLGVLCRGVSMPPIGYAARNCGAHSFCLPAYQGDTLSPAFYRIVGYMATADGFVAVAKRRTLLWTMLGLFGGIAFILSYLMFRYGPEGALAELMRFWKLMLL